MRSYLTFSMVIAAGTDARSKIILAKRGPFSRIYYRQNGSTIYD